MSFESEKEYACPYCGSPNIVTFETGEGSEYELITDCETCCRPIVLNVRITDDDYQIDAHAENE